MSQKAAFICNSRQVPFSSSNAGSNARRRSNLRRCDCWGWMSPESLSLKDRIFGTDMDATNMIPAYSLVDDGDFYTMKTENGGVHYFLPELFPPLGSIHHQSISMQCKPHPISRSHSSECVYMVYYSIFFLVLREWQAIAFASSHHHPQSLSWGYRSLFFLPSIGLSLLYLRNLQAFPHVPFLFIRQDDKQQSNRRKQTLFMAFCISSS